MDGDGLLAYLDDIIVAGKTFEDCLRKLKKLFFIMESVCLTFKLQKCKFFMHHINFLGHTITRDGILPGAKTDAVAKFNRPENVHDVRRFLGLAGYFRKFVQNYSGLVSPLTMLLKNDVKFEWSNECEYALEKLKKILSEKPLLVVIIQNLSMKFIPMHLQKELREFFYKKMKMEIVSNPFNITVVKLHIQNPIILVMNLKYWQSLRVFHVLEYI